MNSPFVPIGGQLCRLLGLVVSVISVSPLAAQFGSGFDSAPAAISRPWELPIYYPPLPPILGAPVPLPMLSLSRRSTPAPPALAEYVNEIFYAPLSTRLHEKQLTTRQREKLSIYRNAKVALQTELRSRIADLKAADPDARTQQLAEFSRAQAPRLAQLEKMAEELRHDLIHGEFFQSNVDWNAIRGWRLGDSNFNGANDAMNAQYQVMLSAAFYQNGLLPEQRGLLREIAMELQSVRRRVTDDDPAGRSNPPLFFSPATSRLLLPPGIPSELSEKVARYEREKSLIKQELRDVVYAQDKTFFTRSRNREIERLAERQWPRIAANEDLAEEIRREIALLPAPPGPPPPPPLPAALSVRIVNFLTSRNELRAEMVRKVDQLRKDFPFLRIQATRNAAGGADLKMQVSTRDESNEPQMKALRATLSAMNQEAAFRQGQLRNDEQAIRREFETTVDMGSGLSATGILDTYAEILQQREDWSLYGDYQTAMLTPGLSAEQRRLLYDTAVEQLELPLPNWDQIVIRVVN